MELNGHAIARVLSDALGLSIHGDALQRLGGGATGQAWRVTASDQPLFVKVTTPDKLAILEAEAAGLSQLRNAAAVRVPAVAGTGASATLSFIAMEWFDLQRDSTSSDALLAEQLASQHRVTAERFGLGHDNWIGSSAQCNTWRDDWIDFLRVHRFVPQLQLAQTRMGHNQRGLLLCDLMHGLFDGYRPQPSLLHGDLWAGNRGTLANGEPVMFDPASYFGDREADIAMTRLFGGFSDRFYSAYESVWPMDVGASVRVKLYNLYHALNHCNMFGSVNYAQEAHSAIDRLLAELGH